MRTIRASEINTFLYCKRAWWYQLQGYTPQNEAELAAGRQVHESHGRTLARVGCLRVLAYALSLLALGLIAYSLTIFFLSVG